jgi:hypothetical protein
MLDLIVNTLVWSDRSAIMMTIVILILIVMSVVVGQKSVVHRGEPYQAERKHSDSCHQ